MKLHGTDHVDDAPRSATSRRTTFAFRILIAVAVLLSVFAVVLMWDASLGVSVHDVTSLFDESDIDAADAAVIETGESVILLIVRDSPKVRTLLEGPRSIEIGGYDLRREYGYGNSDPLVVYRSSGEAHWISMSIQEMTDSQVVITVNQNVGLNKLFGWGQSYIAR